VPAFDHRARTGWALNRFHAALACKACHGAAGAFERVDSNCESCHAGWQKRFGHEQVGLALDEVHAGLDCSSCHADATFSARPKCSDCHDGFSYPAKRPGKAVPPSSRKP
jgi:DnaJ-class molecular chaperone